MVMSRSHWYSCPGSCGELFQGVKDGQEFLLTYGINRKSYARLVREEEETNCSPGEKVSKVLKQLAPLKDGWKLEKKSTLPIGKGMSSSTADMLAGLQALAVFQNRYLTAEELTTFCCQIEPTDSIAFADWTVINPLTGQILFQTDWKPEIYVYILEPRKTEWTVDLARMTESPSYPIQASQVLLDHFKEACRSKNEVLLGQIATTSALLNNTRLPKPYLADIITLVNQLGLLGVNVAHSGTVVGILMTKSQLPLISVIEANFSKGEIGKYYDQRYLSKICFEGVRRVKGG
ncbi:GHMP family kinase ATP-binding protein [Streptococcus suis]|uniref:GHMP family kinase ATP-binding protein n=1 Tax=Streptococcus suis TaxID=1307 RepID=UPI002117584D|nr:kinase [Streptococcus suis]